MTSLAIVSAAYWGDVMPYIPIAQELAGRGHEVTLAVPRGFHEAIGDVPFELVHLGTDFSPRELADHGRIMGRAESPLGMRAAADLWIRQLCIDPAEQILEVLDGLAPDVWLVHPSLYWLVEMAAARHDAAIAVGHVFPMMIPSQEHAPPSMPTFPSPALNRFAWRAGRSMTGRMMFDREINQLRAGRGLEPVKGNVGFGWQAAPTTLLLNSPHYWPPAADWPEQVVQIGFTVWTGGGAELPRDLDAWLDDGPPPVVVTFGTSAATNAGDAFVQVADAVEAAGHRPLLLVGNERNRAELAHRSDVWTFAPLPPLLPRCRAIVHAGGHGSTAAALHAGVPQLAMPMGFDQIGHAERIEQLGVGASLAFRRRSPDRLVTALGPVLSSSRTRAAQTLAEQFAGEDGPAAAADRLEMLAAAAGRG